MPSDERRMMKRKAVVRRKKSPIVSSTIVQMSVTLNGQTREIDYRRITRADGTVEQSGVPDVGSIPDGLGGLVARAFIGR